MEKNIWVDTENGGEVSSSEGPLSALQQLSAGRQDGILTGDEAEEGQHARPPPLVFYCLLIE